MSIYSLPDPTGTNPLYLVTNFPYHVYQAGVKVVFENSAIFAESLIIALTDGTGRQLVKDVDWEVRSDDIDHMAMSRANLEDPNFIKTLVKSVTIKSNLAVGLKVALTFQQFDLVLPGRTFDDGTPFEVTPDSIKDLHRSVADLRQQVARVVSPVAPNPTAPALLPFDINGQRNGNKIVDEVIQVNTLVGGKVIRLANGAFFGDSVVIKYNGQPLNPATDYMPTVVSPLTKRTTNTSGIYQFIQLNNAIAGTIQVSYHAVGGEVQIADINSVYEQMVAIKTYLDEGIFVTADTLADTPTFRAVFARQALLEEDMRRLLTGTPTYGDASAGAAVTRPISTPDADMHWWTIATLYQVQGSTDIIRAGHFKGRVYLPTSKISLSFSVDVNIDQTRNTVSFDTESVVFDPKYDLFTDLSVAAPQYPLVRVVWADAAQSFSGACIQIGLPLPNLADYMVVENMSTAESCWIMSRLNEFVAGGTVTPSIPEDNGFLLPDAVTFWAEDSSICRQEVFVPEHRDGYLVYSGSQVAVTNLITVSNTGSLFNVNLPTYFPIERIRELVVTMVDDTSVEAYDIVIPMTGLTDAKRQGRMTFADSDYEGMVMTALLEKDVLNAISLSLNITELTLPLVSGDPSDKTDLVRYVRARV